MAADTIDVTAFYKKGVGAKTKGYLKNDTSGEIKKFMFNPSSLEFTKSASYSEIASPGLNYPLTQYVRGNSFAFTLPLYIYDRAYTGAVKEWEDYLNKFLPPKENSMSYTKPDSVTVVMGSFIHTCVLESMQVQYTDFNSDLEPIEATLTLSLKVV